MKLRNSILAVGTMLCVACGSTLAADTIATNTMWAKETVKADKNARVMITSQLGDVKIRTWSHNKVVVRSEGVNGTFVVDATSDGSNININVNGYGPTSQTLEAVHVIYVPETAFVELGAISGDVKIDDPSRLLTVDSTRSPSF